VRVRRELIVESKREGGDVPRRVREAEFTETNTVLQAIRRGGRAPASRRGGGGKNLTFPRGKRKSGVITIVLCGKNEGGVVGF